MGKDLNGKELGRGITQRKDGRYMGRIHIKGSKKEITEYSCAITPQVRQTGNRLSGLAGTAYASLLA